MKIIPRNRATTRHRPEREGEGERQDEPENGEGGDWERRKGNRNSQMGRKSPNLK